MKIKYLALAVAALGSAGAANAYTDTATNVYLTGASAIRNNVAAGIANLCTAAGGSLTVFKNGSSTSSLANQMAYVCTAGLAGTPITTVIHTVTGGSLNSILGMSDQAAKQQQPVSLTTGCTAAVAGSGALLGYSVKPNCALEAVAASDGGFSDVEYQPVREQVDILTNAIDGFEIGDVTTGATFVAQAFGIGVSNSLYKGLQTDQGLAACGVGLGDPTPACQPTLSKADIVSLINIGLFNPQKNGAENLSPGLTAGASIEYARRVTTSGTQSGAQIYFLGKGCLEGLNGGNFQVIGDDVAVGAPGTPVSYNSGLFKVSSNSGTGDVITRLNSAGYVFGVVSAENRAPSGTTGWKFVKLNGVAISDGTSGGFNKANAISGSYDYAVEAVSFKGPVAKTDADEGAVIDAIAGAMGTPSSAGGAATVGLFILPENPGGYSNASDPADVSKYQRGGSTPNSCQPFSAF